MLLHFNCAAERSRLDLRQWRDNLLLWFMNVPLQNWRSRNWGINQNFPVQAVASNLLLKQPSQRHPEILLAYPTFPGWPCNSQDRARTSPSWEGCNAGVSWLLFVARGIHITDLTLKRVWRFPAVQKSKCEERDQWSTWLFSTTPCTFQHAQMARGAFPLPGHFPSPSHQLVFDHWQPSHLGRHSKCNLVKPLKELHRRNKNFLSFPQFSVPHTPLDLVMTQLQVRHL